MERNLKRSINLTGLNSYSNGAFCSYYLYNATQGIKVFYSDGHKTIKALRKSRVWKRATKENSTIKKCKLRYYYIPEAYGTYPIKIRDRYYPGIVMQHIYGKTLSEMNYSDDIWKHIINVTTRALKYRGIQHDDLHKGNIIWNIDTKRYYVLDFTPEYIWLDNGYN